MKQKLYVTGAEAINVKRRVYWSEAYGDGVITNLYDAFGDETEDEEDAVRAVVKIHDKCWLHVDLGCFEQGSLQH